MSVAAIRAAIVATIGSVADIGVVQAYERYSANLADLKPLYWSSDHGAIRGWYVRRLTASETGNVQGRTVEVMRWRVTGFMSLNDAAASELTFDDLIESLRDAFSQDQTLAGTVDQCVVPDSDNGESGLQLDDSGPVMFAGVLCHSCRCSLYTTRYLERQP